jgi:hypothetical protein
MPVAHGGPWTFFGARAENFSRGLNGVHRRNGRLIAGMGSPHESGNPFIQLTIAVKTVDGSPYFGNGGRSRHGGASDR